jgi:glycosyltransferase involved in cell wall biosynthesis
VVTCDSGEFVGIPDIDYGLQLRWRHRRAVNATVRLATRVTVCSGYMARLARGHKAIPVIIPLGVDVSLFSPAIRHDNGPPWRLVHVARRNPVKDQPTLLHALRRVIDRVPMVHLDIAGEDTMGGAINDLARQLGVDAHVTFHGVLPSRRLADLYRTAHLFVLSSRHEAAAVVVLEAAASGVPIVGTSVDYLADWAPERAVAVPAANPAALADAIIATLGNPAERQRLAASAREWALAHDADWTARKFIDLYEALVRSSRSG